MKQETNECTLFYKEYATFSKSISIYVDDLDEEGEDVFQVDCIIEDFNDGTEHISNAMSDLNKVISAYKVSDYDDLMYYFAEKYTGDEDGWKKIINEMREKGLDVNTDDSANGSHNDILFMSDI